jgi:hypothetical protein
MEGAAIWYCSLQVRIPRQAWMLVAVQNWLKAVGPGVISPRVAKAKEKNRP